MRNHISYVAIALAMSMSVPARAHDCSGLEMLRVAGTWEDGSFNSITLYSDRALYRYPNRGEACLTYAGTLSRFSVTVMDQSRPNVVLGIASYRRESENLWQIEFSYRSGTRNGTTMTGRAIVY